MMIKVKVSPGTKKEAVFKKSEGRFEVSVKEKARQGAANERLIHVLAGYFRVPSRRVFLRSGLKRRNKIMEIIFPK